MPIPLPSPLPFAARRAWGRRLFALLALGAFAAPGAAAAQASARPPAVTILDGNALLLRGAQKLVLAEGVRLADQDIVETAADARLVRIEFTDGLAISLGPASRLLITPGFSGERGRFARLYLLQGWIKLNLAPPPAAATEAKAPAIPLLATPAFELLSATGSVVASVQSVQARVFVEAGSLGLQERSGGKKLGAPLTLRHGEFLSLASGTPPRTAQRPAPEFVASLPRSFLDTLPARASLFKDRDVAPKLLGEFTYAEVRDWLAAESTLRRGGMNRWRPLTRNADFRKALVDNMAAHPEWDRVLFPEKYPR